MILDNMDDDFSDQDSVSDESETENLTKSKKRVKYEDITDEAPRKKPKSDLYKAPTVQELNELKETQNLYNNNLFRLQIEEIIKEVKIKNKHVNAVTKWYQAFLELIAKSLDLSINLSDIKPTHKKKVSNALINALAEAKPKIIASDQDFVLKLTKPESSEIFGLYKLNSLPGPHVSININVKMPRVVFNVKDFLNNRYFLKRYYYLVYIKNSIKDICESIKFVAHDGNNLLPILQITPKDSDKITIKIFVSPTENYFKPSRLLPDMNNFKNCDKIGDSATVLYNSGLAHDVTLTLNHRFIEDSLNDLNSVQEAIKLIKIWLSQRHLNSSFTDSLILYFITYLVVKKRINKHMSSYQVVRNFWNFINESDLNTTPISLNNDVKDDVFDKFKANFDTVFLDKSGCYNVTAFLNLDLYNKVKSECKIAFKLVDDGGINSFHSLFITRLPLEIQYDLILSVHSKDSFKKIITQSREEDQIKYLQYPKLLAIKQISNTLKRGLNKRALLIAPVVNDDNFSWDKNAVESCDKISFGVNLDPTTAFSFLEMGPALNDPREKEFREFWGSLSSDRRFKDGSVCVAVYFETKTIKDKREIIKTIVDWVISKKLSLDYKLYYNELEDLIVNKKINASYPMGTNEECCLKLINASDELGKILRSLEMPLSITGAQGISDVYNFSEPFPPVSTTYKCGKKVTNVCGDNIVISEKRIGVVPRYVKPIECVLQLEQSSKWPRDLEGISHMKTAFYLEMSKLCGKKHKIVSKVTPNHLDIFYEGFVFRYRLYLPREIGLLKKESTNNGVTVYKDSLESRQIELKLGILPKLISALKGVQSQFPSYGPSTALIKRWLRSHLIDDFHFPEIAINLLNASLYINQTAFMDSTTPQIGFMRFLKFFSELQCNIQAVLINFNDEIPKENLAELDSKLLQNREAYPNLYLATPFDNCESLFTKTSPSKEILRRVKQLSGETLNCLFTIIREEKYIKIKELFVPNLDGFNLIINMRPLLNPLRHEQVICDELEGQINLEAYNSKESNKMPVVDFNPVQLYLRDLRDNYGDFALFFHDTYGGNIIGVLWAPKALEIKDFKVNNVNGRKVENSKLNLNIDALIEDFYILGKDLVKSIDKIC